MNKNPYGIINYAELVKGGYAYVDKTRFIELMESYTCISFFRPRKFGKSLLLSTLSYYYNYQHAGRFDELFGNTFIGSHPTPLRNKFSVIKFDFSAIESSSIDKVYKDFKANVTITVKKFIEKNQIEPSIPIDYENSPAIIMKQFLNYAIEPFEHPLYVLIDEYDHFANNMLGLHTEDFTGMVSTEGFVRCFFEELKIGRADNLVSRIVLTGVCPITIDSMTSGFNIALDLTRLLPFNEMAGFRRDEVNRLINETLSINRAEAEDLLEQMASLYNGYNFCGSGAQKLFNSDMVLYFLTIYAMTGQLPKTLLDKNVLSDYSKLQAIVSLNLAEAGNAEFKQIEAAKALRTEAFISVIKGEPQAARFTDAFELVKFSHDDFLSFLFFMGYLTIESEEDDKVRFVLPNEVIRRIFCDYFANMYLGPTLGVNSSAYEDAMRQMSSEGRNELYVKCLSDILGLSPDRIYLNFSEKHFQFLGYIVAVGYTGYKVAIEKDIGYGYVDLAFLPGAVPVKYYALEELKYIKAGELNPSGMDGAELEAYRMRLIKERWGEGLKELRKYSQNPEFATLQKEGRLKKWITIFSTHRCLVNQEIDVNDKDIEMQLLDFEWWFPSKPVKAQKASMAKRSPRSAKTIGSSRSRKKPEDSNLHNS
ncbi:MAG: ATP-binding protein [Clostridiales bacterium]|jgi:hypothetical protein|nr:ATP-binding protein [Clostridiales bacterium]